ncbi:hypothetical protein MJ1_0273 [Nanobdella aerobiophila]|uniref:Uncharacterized protein n=1 Tax=Nanobdella aerobiophila TaxID=2586965 RepID=A0A915SK55_9ARCH|nr:hypothetical protein [Nanobdella aerobiophila]BBL45443.1 hypothetical protein MJ1_0273 [Nanobdella aerobiophila]
MSEKIKRSDMDILIDSLNFSIKNNRKIGNLDEFLSIERKKLNITSERILHSLSKFEKIGIIKIFKIINNQYYILSKIDNSVIDNEYEKILIKTELKDEYFDRRTKYMSILFLLYNNSDNSVIDYQEIVEKIINIEYTTKKSIDYYFNKLINDDLISYADKGNIKILLINQYKYRNLFDTLEREYYIKSYILLNNTKNSV